MTFPPLLRLGALLALLPLAAACGSNGPAAETRPVGQADVDVDGLGPHLDPTLRTLDLDVYVETGDVEALRRRGKIRFANVARAHIEELPRLRWGAPNEEALVREFADRLGIEAQFQEFPNEEAARAALLEGLVDGIVGRSGDGSTPPPEGIAHSVAFNRIPGVFVSRAGAAPQSLADLAGRRVVFGRGARLIGLSDALKARVGSVQIDTVDVASATEGIDMILDGRADVTLAEKWVADAVVKTEGAGRVMVQLVFEPPWTPDRMSDEARLELDMF